MGACLAILEKKILLVDADPQANSTSGLGIETTPGQPTIYDCMINGVEASKAIIPTETPNLSILPSHIDLVGAELELVSRMRREKISCSRFNSTPPCSNQTFSYCFSPISPEGLKTRKKTTIIKA